MRNPKGIPCHNCAPPEWRNVPNITGCVTLDRVIRENPNKDMPSRLKMYCESDNVYGSKTAYSGYHGYSGDD